MKLAAFDQHDRPDQPTAERDDTAEWVNCAWVEDSAGGTRCLFWFDHEADAFAEFDATFRLRVAPIAKPAFQERQAKRLAPLSLRFGGQDKIPEAARDNANVWALAHEILIDWDGVEDDDGPVAYQPKHGIDALRDYRLRDALVTASSTLELERRSSVEEDAETLGNASNGASQTARGSKTKRAKTRSLAPQA